MRNSFTIVGIVISILLAPNRAAAKIYTYSELLTKDYDEMNVQVQARIEKARKLTKGGDAETPDRAAIEELREGLKLIFSRPDTDNMVAKLVPEVRRGLSKFSAYEDVLSSLVAEALTVVKDDTMTKPQRITSIFVLTNVLSESRPEISGNPSLKRVVNLIAGANIKIAKDVMKECKQRTMFELKNPSLYAQEILKELAPPTKK